MKHPVSILLLALAVMVTGTACSVEREYVIEVPLATSEPAPNAPKERKTAERIVTTGGICSATKVGPKTLLSASHCFRSATRVILVGSQPAIIERVLIDTNDHALVLISEITLKDFATFGPPPEEGDAIHYWGNPHVYTMMLRRGYVSGYEETSTVYDVNGYKGDSGAGIFDKNNRLVGVISYVMSKDAFSMMGSYPFNFTAGQLAAVGLEPEPLLMSGIKSEIRLRYAD